MEQQISKLQIKILIHQDQFITQNLDKMTYHDRLIIQGLLWLNGRSVHNDIDSECCPDFSCCVPNIFEKDKEKRQRTYDDMINGLMKK